MCLVEAGYVAMPPMDDGSLASKRGAVVDPGAQPGVEEPRIGDHDGDSGLELASLEARLVG